MKKLTALNILLGMKNILCKIGRAYLYIMDHLVSDNFENVDEDDDSSSKETEFIPLDAKEYKEKEYVEDDELPFRQLFDVNSEMCLLIDHVEMCPDETAFIRVVDDEGYTPLYKRKIRRDKNDNRFIVFSGENYYLDEKKTQPIIKSNQ